MEYKALKTLYYKNREEYDRERNERPKSFSANSLPLDIHGAQAYYVDCQQLTLRLTECYTEARKLNGLLHSLPGVAQRFYLFNCVIDEIMLSNDLEGVRSTRKEIRAIIDADRKAGDKKARLEGMVKKYLRLLDDDDHIDLNDCEDIRSLYDELVAGEIAREDLPDGKIFRKGPVSVVTATDKEKHKGIAPPEENIIRHMEKAIAMLQDESIPALIRIALFHYFIGYIHPFYDGNGRLSRFISSFLLMKHLDELTALRLSYAIKEKKSKYYEAFDQVNDKKNAGDTTPFLLAFLEIILAAENSLNERISQGIDKLDYYVNAIGSLEKLLDPDEMKILYVLLLNRLFSPEPLGIAALADAVKMGKSKAREKLKQLIEKLRKAAGAEVITTRREGHKYIYSIDLDELEKLCTKYKK